MSITVDYQKTKAFVEEIFFKTGLKQEYAKTVADNLMEAEVRGVKSHGLVQVKNYVRALESGKMQKDGMPAVLRESPASAVIDGAYLPGSVSGKFAMRKTIEKAKETGVAVTVVQKGTHFGMAAYYAMEALKENMIGLAFCNAGTIVAPYGGYGRELGTNPICVAVPAQKELPVVYDAATSYQAFNKIFFAKTENRKIPLGWAVDSQGNPTENPKDAMEGALLPFGGYKGYGLAVIVNIITGILSGASIAKEEDSRIREDTQEVGFNFMAIDIEKFQNVSEFKLTVDLFLERLKSSRRKENERIWIPGEIEFQKKKEGLEKGIVIYDGVKESLISLEHLLNTNLHLNECLKER